MLWAAGTFVVFALRLSGCTRDFDLGGSGFGTACLDSGESGTLFGSTKNGIKSNSNFMIKINNTYGFLAEYCFLRCDVTLAVI